MKQPLHLVINIDGGSRGNPGPSGAGIVIRTADDGTVIWEAGLFLGHATSNQAEYRGLLAALAKAAELGASHVDVLSDSELLVRQMEGLYRVKNPGLKTLFENALLLRNKFTRCTFRHVYREQNAQADRLANKAMNLKRNVEDDGGDR